MTLTHSVPPYQINSVAIEKVNRNYVYGNCYDCQKPSLPEKPVKSLQHPAKVTCSKVKFTFTKNYIVYFDLNKWNLRTDEKRNLIKWLEGLKNVQEFTIKGYTDKIGNKSYNDKLAEKRALSVAKLIREKFPNSQIKIEAEGKCCYRSERNCLNRRVEITAKESFIYKPKLEVEE